MAVNQANLISSGVRDLIINGSCNALSVGDSQATFAHMQRQTQQWSVDVKGAYIDPQTANAIGFKKIDGAPANATLSGFDPDEAGNTGDGPFTSSRRREVVWSGDSTDNASIIRFQLIAADWQGLATLDWDGFTPRSRHLLVNTPTSPAVRARTLIDGGSTETEANGGGNQDPAAFLALESTRNSVLADGWATIESRIITGNLITEGAGDELVMLGCRIYCHDKTTGFEIGAHAWGGATSADHASGSNYNATMLAAEMAQTETNLVIIKLGQNDSGGSPVSKAQFKSNIEAIITKYTTACAAGVKFLLVSTWETENRDAALGEYADALYEISQASPSIVAFVNLYQIIKDNLGAWSAWEATYLSDGVHANDAGDDLFGGYLWAEIQNASVVDSAAGSASDSASSLMLLKLFD